MASTPRTFLPVLLLALACEQQAVLPGPETSTVGTVIEEWSGLVSSRGTPTEPDHSGTRRFLDFPPDSIATDMQITIRRRHLNHAMPSTLPACSPPVSKVELLEVAPPELRLRVPARKTWGHIDGGDIIELFFAAVADAPFIPKGTFVVPPYVFGGPTVMTIPIDGPGFWVSQLRKQPPQVAGEPIDAACPNPLDAGSEQ